MDDPTQTIHWPDAYQPERTAVHVRNELAMAAPCAAVWAWLVRAELWPRWYCNSHDVRIEEGPRPDLELKTRFRWRTFSLAIESTVEELVPGERIGWSARGLGIRAYHGWLLRPTADGGCHVLTEENQNGPLARLQGLACPGRMHKGHQEWLEGLAWLSALGPPPPV
jgi:uncharacterized protein YndB with AHSA1/START domain